MFRVWKSRRMSKWSCASQQLQARAFRSRLRAAQKRSDWIREFRYMTGELSLVYADCEPGCSFIIRRNFQINSQYYSTTIYRHFTNHYALIEPSHNDHGSTIWLIRWRLHCYQLPSIRNLRVCKCFTWITDKNSDPHEPMR